MFDTKNQSFENFLLAVNFDTLANVVANSPRMTRKYKRKTYHKVHREQRLLKTPMKYDPSNRKGGDRHWVDNKREILIKFVRFKDGFIIRRLER